MCPRVVCKNGYTFDVVDEKFQELLNGFMDEHYHHFDDEEENKFIYTDIFNLYVSDINVSIAYRIEQNFDGF